MSDLISAAAGLAQGLGAWRFATLLPCSFRGAIFSIARHDAGHARRVVAHEFPLREEGYTEDLGRDLKKYRITGYVVGEFYMRERDALLAACAARGPGLLTHPYLGMLRVNLESVSFRESVKEGGYCEFDLAFIEAGTEPSPVVRVDTQAGILSTATTAISLARAAFRLAYAVGNLGRYATNLAVTMAGALLGIPGKGLTLLTGDIAALAATDGSDATATGAAITSPFSTVADAAGAAPAGAFASASDCSDALGAAAVTSRGALVVQPFAAGDALLAFATYADPSPAPIVLGSVQDATEAASRSAVENLVRDSAVAAAAAIYAGVNWPSENAAAAARLALADAISDRMDAAAYAGLDDLYRAWLDVLAALVADDAARNPVMPRLGAFRLQAALPSLVLAHRLYGDASRADELVALNDVPHPAFMPEAGSYLT